MRVFLLLLTIQCVPDDYRPVDTLIEYDSPYELVRIARPKVKGMRRTSIGDVSVYWRHDKAQWHGHELNLIAERGGSWFQLRDERGLRPTLSDRVPPRAETERAPVIAKLKRGPSLIRVTWIEEWMGANRAGLTRRTVILDFRAKPRVFLSIDCSDADGGGVCTAPNAAHDTRAELTCDDDLRCTMRQSVFVGWTRRAATRTFDLLTNATIAPSRFDAVRYASGAAFAAAGPDAVRQRALIDGIGIVQPVYEVSPGVVIFAAHKLEPLAGFRFFLLDRGTWREIPLTLLADSVYPGDPLDGPAGAISRGFTPDAPHLVFTAYDLGLPGKRKLIEIVGTEGEARSIHWIMVDPSGKTGALRVATNRPEWRHCGEVVYPMTASCLGIPESGLPARVNAVASWRVRNSGDPLPPTCDLVGTIDWSSKRGWIVRVEQAPCTDPMPRPFGVMIDDSGEIRVERVNSSR